MGHALGFGTVDKWFDLLVNRTRDYYRTSPTSTTLPDAYFPGTAAVSAFDEVASSYTDGKVPVENDSVSSSSKLSKITVAALADLGYRVDYTQADSYTLPGSSSVVGSQLPEPALRKGLPSV